MPNDGINEGGANGNDNTSLPEDGGDTIGNIVDDAANGIYPMPIKTSNQDKVFIGRIREDLAFDNGIALVCSGDQVRKGAAVNAVQIAIKLIERL
jgi:aspartate-semialdehyde dehydrogenase